MALIFDKFLLIYTLIILCEAQRSVIWEENFNENKLDDNRWIIKAKKDECEKQFNHLSKSCNSVGGKNIQVSNGTLKLTAIHESYLGANFTGATIMTRMCFDHARIEIRARKPIGQQLHAGILMYSFAGQCGLGDWKGEVDIVKLRNDSVLWSSLHYGKYQSVDSTPSALQEDLNDYQVYIIEWNATTIEWFINGRSLRRLAISEEPLKTLLNGTKDPFFLPFDHTFNLVLHVGVNSFIAVPPKLTELTNEDIQNWVSPSLEIDYIRVYENQSKGKTIPTLYLVIIPLVALLVILVILLLIAVLMWKKQKKKNVQDRNDELYDNNIDGLDYHDNTYEQYDYSGSYEKGKYEEVQLSEMPKTNEYLVIEG